jgi:branched-chain amino acid transport system substrate-binding protein
VPRPRSSPSQDLKLKKCYVLNDNQTYGQGVAKAFADEAAKQNIQVLGNEAWDAKATDYKSLMGKIKTAGADCVYLGGIYDNNGGQVVKDKVAVLGANDGRQAARLRTASPATRTS